MIIAPGTLVGAFSVIVKTGCGTYVSICGTREISGNKAEIRGQ